MWSKSEQAHNPARTCRVNVKKSHEAGGKYHHRDGIRAEGVSQGRTEGHRQEGHARTKRGRVGNVCSMFGVPHRHAGMWCVWRAEVAEETEQGLQGLCPQARGIRGTKQARSQVYQEVESRGLR